MVSTLYDDNNPFAKILRKELPAEVLYENDNVLVFADINPRTKFHYLIIPKKPYVDYSDFLRKASAEEICEFHKAILTTARILRVEDNYRTVVNNGNKAGQIVFHLHCHFLSDVGVIGEEV